MAEGDVKVLGAWPSPFVMRARIALNLKSVSYEFLEETFGAKSELLLKSNPVYKKIPVLIHGEKPVCESLIIVQYIDEVWTSGPSILPSDPYERAIARFWATYIDDKWFPSLTGIAKGQTPEEKSAAIEGVVTGLGLLEEAFKKCSNGKAFFGGDQIGYLDIAFGSYLGWLKVSEKMSKVTFMDALRTGGRFICLTLAESHVLDVLFSKFRLGWKMNIHVIPQKLSNKLQTFMVVVEKERSAVLHEITSSFDHSSLYCDKNQARGLFHALDTENKIRSEKGVDILHSLEDLQLGAEGGLEKLIPGRRLQLTLGEDGHSRFSYKAVLLDAQGQSDQFLHHCGIFLVPKIRAHEWLFSSEEGQWMIVESSKAARLVMVILDARHSLANLDDIQTDLSPLVKHLAPVTHDDSAQIPFMMAGDGIKQREIVHQVTSAMTGPIIVEDVVYENIDTSVSSSALSKDMKFRRLTFQRSSSLVQSEAHLISEGCKNIGQMDNKKTNSILKSKKKVNRKRSTAVPLTDESRTTVVDHQYLASSYHVGIISGFMLVVSNLLSFASSEQRGKTIIVGLGAGLLPMFLHECMAFLDIEVVELDPTVLILARQYFGFIEDTQLKVHVRNGIEFVQNFASMAEPSVLSVKYQNGSASSEEKSPSNGSGVVLGPKSSRIDILIVDVDSSDSSSGLTCPHPDFVEVSFLNSVKETLSEGGLFVINLVSRSASIREKIISRIKEVFNHLYSLHLEEDVNEVIFALHTESTVTEGSFPDAAIQLEKLLKSTNLDIVQQIIDTTKKIKVL